MWVGVGAGGGGAGKRQARVYGWVGMCVWMCVCVCVWVCGCVWVGVCLCVQAPGEGMKASGESDGGRRWWDACNSRKVAACGACATGLQVPGCPNRPLTHWRLRNVSAAALASLLTVIITRPHHRTESQDCIKPARPSISPALPAAPFLLFPLSSPTLTPDAYQAVPGPGLPQWRTPLLQPVPAGRGGKGLAGGGGGRRRRGVRRYGAGGEYRGKGQEGSTGGWAVAQGPEATRWRAAARVGAGRGGMGRGVSTQLNNNTCRFPSTHSSTQGSTQPTEYWHATPPHIHTHTHAHTRTQTYTHIHTHTHTHTTTHTHTHTSTHNYTQPRRRACSARTWRGCTRRRSCWPSPTCTRAASCTATSSLRTCCWTSGWREGGGEGGREGEGEGWALGLLGVDYPLALPNYTHAYCTHAYVHAHTHTNSPLLHPYTVLRVMLSLCSLDTLVFRFCTTCTSAPLPPYHAQRGPRAADGLWSGQGQHGLRAEPHQQLHRHHGVHGARDHRGQGARQGGGLVEHGVSGTVGGYTHD